MISVRVRKAVIPAAGLGTRFLPATKAQPKEMLPLVDTPIIQYVVQEAIESGIEDIIIITGRTKRAIEDHFDRSVELETFLSNANKQGLLSEVRELGSLADIHFVRQKEQLGLGHAVYQARRHIGNEPFAVLLGDEVYTGQPPCLAQLINQYQQVNASVIGVQQVALEDVHRYGIIQPQQVGPRLYKALDLVEKPDPTTAPSNFAIIGRYVLDPQVFDVLENTGPGRNGEIQLTDALKVLSETKGVYGFNPDTTRYDVGERLGYLIASLEFGLSRPDLGPALRQYLVSLARDLAAKA
jgi:UTP--glucose-1-phosphate uridylyltransferase